MATPTGGYRRTFIDSFVDCGSTPVTAYTCPADTVAEIQLRVVTGLGGPAANLTAILRQLSGTGANVDDIAIGFGSPVITGGNISLYSADPSSDTYIQSKYDRRNYRAFLMPGDTVRVQTTNAATSARVRYVVVEEKNSDV